MATTKLYVPLSASSYDDDRLMRAGDEAELLWYRALQLAKRSETDGALHQVQLKRISPNGQQAIDALVAVGLLRRTSADTFELAGWLDWNDSKAQVEAKREKERQRKAYGGRGGRPADANIVPQGIRAESGRNDTGIPTESTPESATESREEQSREEQEEHTLVEQNDDTDPAQPPAARRDGIVWVFNTWRTATGHPKAILDTKRRRIIQAAIASHGIDDTLAAVQGVTRSPHHMGQNPTGTRYDDIALVLRDAEHIERFRDLHRGEERAPAAPPPPRPEIGTITAQAACTLARNYATTGQDLADLETALGNAPDMIRTAAIAEYRRARNPARLTAVP